MSRARAAASREVLEQLAAVFAEIMVVEPHQAHQVGVDPELGWTSTVATPTALMRLSAVTSSITQ
jgi:hypothetical protein